MTLNESKTKVVNFSIVWSSSPDLVQYRPFFSTPELVEFPTSKPGQKAYAYFYPPSNPNFQGLADEKPPLLVKTHGELFKPFDALECLSVLLDLTKINGFCLDSFFSDENHRML